MSSPHGDLVLFWGFYPSKFLPRQPWREVDSKLTFKDHVRGIVSSVSQRIDILRLVKRIFVDGRHLCVTSLLFCICSPNSWVLFSSVGSAAECHNQLLEHQVYLVARLCPDQSFLSLCHRRYLALLCMLYKVNSNSNHSLFRDLPSASSRVRHTRAAAAAHPFEFKESRCCTSLFARSFLPAQVQMWSDLPYTVFDTGTLDGFKGAVDRWLLPCIVFCSVFRDINACGVAKAIYKQFFPPLRPVLLILIIIIISFY